MVLIALLWRQAGGEFCTIESVRCPILPTAAEPGLHILPHGCLSLATVLCPNSIVRTETHMCKRPWVFPLFRLFWILIVIPGSLALEVAKGMPVQ